MYLNDLEKKISYKKAQFTRKLITQYLKGLKIPHKTQN